MFHICDTSRKISFLCPNGTIFSQSHLICDWWFKVDCASAPALYESSVEYYSNEQKKSQRANVARNSDLQQIGADTNVRAESRRAPVNVPTTTERFLRHKQKLQSDNPSSNGPIGKPTARNYQALFEVNPTQRAQTVAAFENRRKNLVQLISNNFGNGPAKTTLPVFDSSTYRTAVPVYDHNSLREMQVAAETASFAQNQNRQFLQEYNSKNFRPFPVYTPNSSSQTGKTNNPSLTTLYDIHTKQTTQYLQEATTKRQTLVPYTKSSASTVNERREPYTRPGISLLRDFLEKEKNKTLSTATDKLVAATARSDKFESQPNSEKGVTPNPKNTFESVTKIPDTTGDDKTTKTASTADEVYSTLNQNEPTTEESYQYRRDRLMRKLNFETSDTEEPTTATTEKDFGVQSRQRLAVPPSLTPKTLHSLAIYYATALDNLSTTPNPEDDETTTPSIDEYESLDHSLPALFSHQTITKYGNLFGRGKDNAELLEDIKLDPNGTYNELAEDLSIQMSQGPLATSPQIRELAQIFTHALSAYLQDPVQFRKVLSDIRPTHPSFAEVFTTTEEPSNTEPTTVVNEEDDELLGFSDDHKIRQTQNSVRGGKALNIVNDYPTTVEELSTTVKPTTELPSTFFSLRPTTPRSPFRCCGRISASYTTASTSRDIYSTLFPYTKPSTVNVNTLATNTNSESASTTETITPFRHGSIRDNVFPSYGKTISSSDVTPFNDVSDITTVPTAFGLDVIESTLSPITNSHQLFESKKIKFPNFFPTTTPTYNTETDSIEFENEEELQRAHSQSFVSPQSNSLRQGKQLKQEDKKNIRKPSENLEAPTQSTADPTTAQTTTQATTTLREQTETLTTASPLSSNIFTSPDSEKSTNDFQWQTTFGNWQSTILDPITLNDGLSPTGPEQGVSEIAQQTNSWALDTATTPTPTTFLTTNEPVFSSTANVEIITSDKQNERYGKFLRDSTTSTEPAQDLSTVTDTIVEKAKEIMGGMNATTTQKLMNVMKKTKSKTVKRLILLLVQTCGDDHNSTAEASKKALLEALMAVSQKDMDEIAKEEDLTEAPSTVSDVEYLKTTEFQHRLDRIPDINRRSKNLNIEAEAINALSSPTTTETLKTEETTEYTTTSTLRTTSKRRGGRKYVAKTTEVEQFGTTIPDRPIAEARVAPQGELKVQSDTRALELLRSLYTIAARWG